MSKSLVEMTAEIVQARISTQEMSGEEIKATLNDTFLILKGLRDAELSGQAPEQAESKPCMTPAKSIQKNRVICLECGESFKMLSPKHLGSHGLTPKEYRKKHGFTMRQPLCAKSLSEKRSESSKKRACPKTCEKPLRPGQKRRRNSILQHGV